MRGVLESLERKMDGLERRRRLSDEIEERIQAFEAGMEKALRKAVLMSAALGAAVAVFVNVLFHFIWR